MSDLFGKVLGTILGKATGSSNTKSSGGGLSAGSSGGGLSSEVLGGLLTNVMGKNGSGISSIVKRMTTAGLGQIIKSWIAKGPNHMISSEEITNGLGADKISELAQQFGIPKEQVASLLAEHLPEAVDQMTPDGEVMDLTPKQ